MVRRVTRTEAKRTSRACDGRTTVTLIMEFERTRHAGTVCHASMIGGG